MIARSRPKYFQEYSPRGNNPELLCADAEELYLNSGRGALMFFLENLSKQKGNKQLHIAMQSFNCEAVIEAALQALCTVELLDISLKDFSIDFSNISTLNKKPDVLILTHYQGIPSLNYIEIAAYCKLKDIVLIDDMSQIESSFIHNTAIGSLCDASINSFAFDKPFSCFTGGSLRIKNISDAVFKTRLLKAYNSLNRESYWTNHIHLKSLQILQKITSPNVFKVHTDDSQLILFLCKILIPNFLIVYILKKPILLKVCQKIFYQYLYKHFHKNNLINILKLGINKIAIIAKQRNQKHSNAEEVRALEAILNTAGISTPQFTNSEFVWNRYTILDEKGNAKALLKNYLVEYGNYNWPRPLHILYNNNINVTFTTLKNTEIAAEHILNIPVWSKYFQQYRK